MRRQLFTLFNGACFHSSMHALGTLLWIVHIHSDHWWQFQLFPVEIKKNLVFSNLPGRTSQVIFTQKHTSCFVFLKVAKNLSIVCLPCLETQVGRSCSTEEINIFGIEQNGYQKYSKDMCFQFVCWDMPASERSGFAWRRIGKQT